MFTGHYPYELGADWEARLDDRYPTLAEYLGQQGYRTGGFVANTIYAGGRTGLDRGFQYYDDQAINLPMLISNSWMARKLVSKATGQLEMPWGTWGRKHAEDVNASFIDWLDDTGDRPFFAFLNYLEAHHPYHVHEPFDTRFSDKLPDARLAWDNLYTFEELENFKLSYDNAIAYLDAQMDALFGELERRGVLENTIVVITSDHGEQLGEQRREAYGHGNSLYASSIEVPLLIYAPSAGVPATRIERSVTLRDLAATITDLLALDAEAPFPGESLAGLWNQSETFANASPVLSELSLNRGFGRLVPSWMGHTRSITSGAFHYIANGDGTEELFDLGADPWELENIVADSADHSQLTRLRSILAAVPARNATAAIAARKP
jgi:arylsulfatase A-like enzyme